MRPDAAFCGQCYADFRPPPPAPVAPVAPAPTAAYGTPAPDPLTAPLLDVVLPAGAVPAGAVPVQSVAPAAAAAPAAPVSSKPSGWPCTGCGTVNSFEEMHCSACMTPFLGKLAEEGRVSLVLPVIGDIQRYGRGQRAAIAVGLIMIILIPLALVTLLLTDSPPKDGTPSKSSDTSNSTGTGTNTPGFVPAPDSATTN